MLPAMKTPFVTKAQVQEIAKTYPTPFYLYDEKGIRENARTAECRPSAWNPGFKEYFAVKATPTPAILKILREEGCGADCSSLTELMMSQPLRLYGQRDHVLLQRDAPPEEFELAAKLGATINLDDFTHIDFLKDTIGYIPETISCRYNPGGAFQLGASKEGFQVMDNPGDAKYGFTQPAARRGLQEAQGHGRQALRPPRLPGLQHHLQRLLPHPGRHSLPAGGGAAGRRPAATSSFINLSGGVGVPYRPDQPANDIARHRRGGAQGL